MEILPLELSRYEIELALYALAKLPYEQSGAVIEQLLALVTGQTAAAIAT